MTPAAVQIAVRIMRRIGMPIGRREIYASSYGDIVTGSLDDDITPIWGKKCSKLGLYWCSHCARWVDAEFCAADTIENMLGPICDDCAAGIIRAMEESHGRT